MQQVHFTTQHLMAQHAQSIKTAAELLTQGELVAVATETVYGLAADARQPEAVKKIFAAKGRPADHPLIVHVENAAEVTKWTESLPDYFNALATAFWPGPLTIVAKKAAHVSSIVTGGHDTVGIRVPNHPAMQALLAQVKTGLAAPSANPYKKISPTTAEQVLFGLDSKIAAVLDGGPCEVGLESTILDISGESPRILRAGPITKQQLESVLAVEVAEPAEHSVAVPGNVKAHYQPNKKLTLVDSPQLIDTLRAGVAANTGILFYSQAVASTIAATQPPGHLIDLKLAQHKPAYAQGLYYGLHQLDQSNAVEILLEAPPKTPEWRDVNDRLMRAAAQ